MSARTKMERSTEAPMDFQFTSRPSSNTKPVWALNSDPRKRPFDDLRPVSPAFPETHQRPMFGENHNVPFIFQTPVPQTPQVHPWAPPPNFSPQKAFPLAEAQELHDVDMSELSPPKPEAFEKDGGRIVATGALRRVFKSRQKARAQRQQAASSHHDPGYGSEEESGDDAGHVMPVRNTSNHYTLNMPPAPARRSDIPDVLLGYLQFFFNLSLVIVFLYLLLQFILTVQRDVEHRISEYSMDIVQEIGMCATQYRSNLCESNPVPAMMNQCASWKTCMDRDPTVVGRARVGAELIAEVVNGFVDAISWKTMAFTLTSLSFLTVFVNSLFSLYRWRQEGGHSSPPHPVPPVGPFPHYYLPSEPTSRRSGNGDDVTEGAPRRRRLEGGQAIKVK